MLRPASQFTRRPSSYLPRWFHVSATDAQAFKQKVLPQNVAPSRPTRQTPIQTESNEGARAKEDGSPQQHVKRNELGVQLLSRQLHSQIFRNVSFPTPDSSFVHIAREHLQMHGLDPTQGSVLPDTGFTLPQLQGSNLLEHFHRIGSHAAEPWLSLAKTFVSSQLPPQPDDWEIQSGWTKYYHHPDGSSYSEHVPYPMHDGKPEEMLAFDVETMPNYHPYAIMACAATPNGWYSWISPWLLGESKDPQHLIPMGDPTSPKVIVGHNVSYDRGRILEEYSLEPTKNRFIDTMALHVAVKGISSHQRPAWMKYRKSKETQAEQKEEAVEAIVELMEAVDRRQTEEMDDVKKEELRRLRQDMEDSLPSLMGDEDPETAEAEILSKRWEDLTSANSLADVAKLHCGITMDKEIRSDFMKLTPEDIRNNVTEYLSYCANDVDVTHRVFSVALPAFLKGCPHPVSFAGILTMGSSFLTVNEEWESYLQRAEAVYREMEEGVKAKLKKLAEDARLLMDGGEKWKDDVWLSQLDWTPKVAGKSRGIFPPEEVENVATSLDSEEPTEAPLTIPEEVTRSTEILPSWYQEVLANHFGEKTIERILPLLLKLSYEGHPLQYNYKERWHMVVGDEIQRISTAGGKKTLQMLCSRHAGVHLQSGAMASIDFQLALDISKGDKGEDVRTRVLQLAKSIYEAGEQEDPWLRQLDWKLVGGDASTSGTSSSPSKRTKKTPKPKPVKPPPVLWPKWYWEAAKPKKDMPPGTLDITVRNRIAPLLLRLSWLGWPLFHSREHGWTFRVPSNSNFTTRLAPLSFYDPTDDALAEASLRGGYLFYKLPHKDGEKANVGSPLSKTFMKFAQDGTLKSPGDEAKEALDMNAQCSYWISARDRIMNQMVVWQDPKTKMGFETPKSDEGKEKKWGIILPQVITMGTVTRRAIEKTWLTASNAKKNRVGSELKAMVRAPEGYAIVGADVDSEELWISSCMGDAQFGLHGATAIGWMTLEGTKAAGTDLHSKTASILGISRDQAKVFNYSRIYGAGMRHAILLLLQSSAGMQPEEAQKLAENLYASTKGKNTHRTDIFDRKFWFGGTESFVFNKLEEIALSDKPQTPALGCGVTYALSKEYLPAEFGSDYMPSRINWVVQSSGVDYLHLLIVSMDHLLAKYDIKARYLISVHDELRYLVKEEDKYRAALALQIANLWTRSLFAYKLGMDDLPQGVAFFSAVDVDRVLRKEVDMPCVTPSQLLPIPPGESLDIVGVLGKTHGGSLWRDGRAMSPAAPKELEGTLEGYSPPNCLAHRAENAAFVRAQATSDFGEVKGLAQRVSGKKFSGGIGGGRPRGAKAKKRAPVGNGEGVDWTAMVEKVLGSDPLRR
ncbi:DNA polymerase family A-domain-containing protein [Lyophyllum atratum]|nr:DNA polymerase family A-domain-containing protein [Lyophyllum atratum]